MINRKQSSVFYFSGPAHGMDVPKPYGDHYVRMFLEDLSRGIIPYRSKESLHLTFNDKASKDLIACGVDENGQKGDFSYGVSEFLRLATSDMCAFDQSVFEIAYLEDSETNDCVGFSFFHIDNRQLKRHWGQLYQSVPKEIAEQRNSARLILLPPEDLLIFSLPPPLAKVVSRVRSGLTRVTESGFTQASFQMIQNVPNYRFEVHEDHLNTALAEVCWDCGWNARGSFRKCTSSYHVVYSLIKWRRFLSLVQKCVFETFNDSLERIKAKLPLKGRVVVRNAPTEHDFDQAFEDLEEGKKSFEDIMNRFF